MIRPEKHTQALKALQSILIWSRWMAYRKDDHAAIADILDWAEYLAGLVAEEKDRTETYASVLQGLADKYPFCKRAAAEFAADASSPIANST
jgi:hypothetical protein